MWGDVQQGSSMLCLKASTSVTDCHTTWWLFLISDIDVFEFGASRIITDVLQWMLKEINMFLRRKRLKLLDKKPGAVAEDDPTVILVRMLRWHDRYTQGSHLEKIISLRAKFNDALNEMACNMNLRIMTMNSCNTSNHYDQWGNLSVKGMYSFWYEMDDLLERFNRGKIKLLPNPRQKTWSQPSPNRFDDFCRASTKSPSRTRCDY